METSRVGRGHGVRRFRHACIVLGHPQGSAPCRPMGRAGEPFLEHITRGLVAMTTEACDEFQVAVGIAVWRSIARRPPDLRSSSGAVSISPVAHDVITNTPCTRGKMFQGEDKIVKRFFHFAALGGVEQVRPRVGGLWRRLLLRLRASSGVRAPSAAPGRPGRRRSPLERVARMLRWAPGSGGS